MDQNPQVPGDEPAAKVKEILDCALDVPPEQRPAFLDRACSGDAELRAQVESLLSALSGAGRFLANPTLEQEQPIAGAGSPIDLDNLDLDAPQSPSSLLNLHWSEKAKSPADFARQEEGPGTIIGRYKLLQKIGEGGMGAVYMAEQEKPVIRKVALKVVKLGMDTKQVIARFEAERQALAMMDHPNIAKVLDAGATKGGRPYFVMELVRGVPITDYCDTNKLSTQQRLELFIPVCRAVQHAHQKGIIHRDIKPSNVMITMHDGVPVPKVIDFGIAKATQGRLTDKTLFTEYHHLVGTPEYMSPEQAEMSGLDIDTRTDVYGLGVLLYELLTGTTPLDSKTLRRAAYEEIHRMIREVEPPKPSTRISSLGQTLTQTAAHRQIDPKKLGDLMRGDLDWIVMKCLEKDRTRRYETANALAMDVARHLENEPVSACPPSRVYRFRKMVRRNKLVFAAASAVVLALVMGLGISTVMFVREHRARQRAVAAEQEQVHLRQEADAARANETAQREQAQANERKARTEAVRSDQVAKVMQDMLSGVEAQVAKGRDTQMLREIMDNTAKRLEVELKDQPDVEADLRATLAQVYADLGDLDAAEAMRRAVLRLRRQVSRGDESIELAEAMSAQAMALDAIDGNGAATMMSSAAVSMIRKLLGEDNLIYANALWAHGRIFRRGASQAARLKAIKVLEQALAIQRRSLNDDADPVVATLTELSMALGDANGRRAEAVEILTKLLGDQKKLRSGDDVVVAGLMTQLGLIHPDREKDDFRMLRDAIAMYTRLYGPGSRVVLQIRGQLGRRLWAIQRRDDAEAEMRAVVDIYTKLPYWGRPFNIGPIAELGELARFLIGDRRPKEAETLYRDVLDRVRPRFAEDDLAVIKLRMGLANCLRAANKPTEAESELRGVATLLTGKAGWEKSEAASDVLDAAFQLAYVLASQRKASEAETAYDEALQVLDKLGDNEHIAVARSLVVVGNTLLSRGKPSEAEKVYRVSMAMKQKLLGEEDVELAVNLNNLGTAASQQAKFPEAEKWYRESIAMTQKFSGDEFNELETPVELRNLAYAMRRQGKFEGAEKIYRQVLAAFEQRQDVASDDWDTTVGNLRDTLREQGEWARAAEFPRHLLELRLAKLGRSHAKTLWSMNNLAWAYYEAGQYELGLPLAESAVEQQRKLTHARTDGSLLFVLDTLASIYEELGLREKAVDLFKENLERAKAQVGVDHPWTRDDMQRLARAYRDAGQLSDAQALFEETLKLRRALGVEDNAVVADDLNGLGWTLILRAKFAEAEPLLRESLAIRVKKTPNSWERFETESLLGAALAGQNKPDAENLLLSGYEGMKQHEPQISIPGRKRIKEAAERLVQFYEAAGKPDDAAFWRAKLAGATTQPAAVPSAN